MKYYLLFIYFLSDFFEKNNIPKWTYFKKGFKLLIPAPKGRVKVKTLYGLNIFVNPKEDKGLERGIYYHGTYERGFLDFLKKNLKNGHVFIDVGANIGLVSLLAGKLVGENGKVFSFEPQPEVYNDLQENIKINSLNNILPFNIGLGNENKQMTLFSNLSVNRGASSLIQPSDPSGEFKVVINRLDDFLEKHQIKRVDFVKIDVEGFELEVLKGMNRLLNTENPPVLIVEFSLERNVAKNDLDLIHFVLSFNKYKLMKFSKGKDRYGELLKVVDFSQLRRHDNIVFIPTQF